MPFVVESQVDALLAGQKEQQVTIDAQSKQLSIQKETIDSLTEKLELLTKELIEKEVLTDREIYELMDIPVPDALLDTLDNSGKSDDSQASTESEEKPAVPPDVDPGLLGLEGA